MKSEIADIKGILVEKEKRVLRSKEKIRIYNCKVLRKKSI